MENSPVRILDEHRKISDILSRNSKTDSFQNRKTVFGGKINLKKEECIELMTPVM
jgi:hypothetical protein